MAFALAVGDVCSPLAVSAFASSTEPPVLGVVTKINPTVVVWQDGREVTYTVSVPVDQGLGKFEVDLQSPFINRKVRPSPSSPLPMVPNVDGRADAVCVLAGTATNAVVDDPLSPLAPVAVVRFNNGLYVVVPQAALEIVPGA